MRSFRIQFTRGEARAVQHRLDLWDSFEEVFADTEGLEHLAPKAAERAKDLSWQLQTQGYVDVTDSDLDREIMLEAIEGSTWPAVHNGKSPQAYLGAVRCLYNAAQRIADVYGLDLADISFPQA